MSGFSATFIEAPEVFTADNYIDLPCDAIDVCKAYPMKYEGNAAGNSSPLNLTGEVTALSSEPDNG